MKSHLAGVLTGLGYLGLSLASRLVDNFPLPLFLLLHSLLWFGFALAYKKQSSFSLSTVVLWAILFRIIACFSIPFYEDDHFRFLWDGMMFAETGNPYGKVPMDYFSATWIPENFVEILDQINYPAFPTIYGIVVEVIFLMAYYIAPGSTLGLQVMLGLADLLLCFSVYLMGGKKGLFIASWCPILIVQTYLMLHPELIGISLFTAALLFLNRRKPLLSSGFLALSVSARIFALPLVPFFFLHFSPKVIGFCLFLMGLLFLASGVGSSGATGVTNTFLSSFEFNSSGFFLLSKAFGSETAKFLGVALFGIIVLGLLFLYRKKLANQDTRLEILPGAIIFTFLLFFSPIANPWYFLWFLPFVALKPSLPVFVLLGTSTLSYIHAANTSLLPAESAFEVPLWVRALEFIPPLLVLIFELKRGGLKEVKYD